MWGGPLEGNMDWRELDRAISELELLMPADRGGSWKPFWSKSQEIQKVFNSKIRYPTLDERTAAWNRFNELRDSAKQSRDQQSAELAKGVRHLDELIEAFSDKVRKYNSVLDGLSFKTVYGMLDVLGSSIHDWRPVWQAAKEIQELFKSGIRYPSKELHDQAWTKFNDARNDASRIANEERDKERDISGQWRDFIIREAELVRYLPLGMFTSFVADEAEEMKKLGKFLNETAEALSKHKDSMIRLHKDECWERIQDVRATHQAFWESYSKAREARHREYRERMRARYEKTEQNIQDNRERLAKAEDALGRVEATIEKLEGLIASAYSDNFREAHEGFLQEAERKRDSIQESIERIQGWIQTSEAELSDISNKLR